MQYVLWASCTSTIGNAMACSELTHLSELTAVLVPAASNAVSTKQLEQIKEFSGSVSESICNAMQEVVDKVITSDGKNRMKVRSIFECVCRLF